MIILKIIGCIIAASCVVSLLVLVVGMARAFAEHIDGVE
jgi:hypothetical protein